MRSGSNPNTFFEVLSIRQTLILHPIAGLWGNCTAGNLLLNYNIFWFEIFLMIKNAVKNKEFDDERIKRDKQILKYAPHIKYLANRLAIRLPSHIDIDDIINSGVIGLIDAIDKFDENKGVQFKTYAEFRIRGAILDNLRSLDWVPRSIRKSTNMLENTYAELEKKFNRPATDDEVTAALNISLEKFHEMIALASGVTLLSLDMVSSHDDIKVNLLDCLADSDNINPMTYFRMEEIRDVVADSINDLPDKEKQVVCLYYYDDLTMKEISKTLNLTESRVSQIHAKAVLRLRGKSRQYLESK